MAKFYTTKSISRHLKNIIEDAKEELILISPYIKADDETEKLIGDKKRSIRINVVYGKRELNSREKRFLEDLSIRTTFRENLHAKCYLNESEALITSMNLYEYSMYNNDEMGILVSKEEDGVLYDAIYGQAKEWAGDDSEEVPARRQDVQSPRSYMDSDAAVQSPKHGENRSGGSLPWERPSEAIAARSKAHKRTRKALEMPTEGFCIRCRIYVPVAPTKPYCSKDYRTWKRFENVDYGEEYCHTCGKEHESTMHKPLCFTCYKKYKDVLEFAEA